MTDKERRASGNRFPCASLDEALPHLRRPPAPEAVRFKIQNTAGDHAQVAAYVDARLVFDRLDLVCGGQWTARFEELPKPLLPPPCDRDGQPLARPPIHVRCRLTAFGVTREDVGEGEDPKAAFSDAIKRAAVHFGVGRALYAMRAPWLRAGEGEGELRRNRRGRLTLDERTEESCRARYRRWLEERGRRLFGQELEHGDETGAPGFEAEAGGAEPEPSPADVRQGRRKAVAHQPEPVPQEEQGAKPQAESAPRHREFVTGRLRAVSDGSAGEPPATALDRQKIAHWRQAGRYREETVSAMAELACGEKVLERLSRDQVRRVAWLLELAVSGRVSQRTLAGAVTRAGRRPQRDEGARALEAWLREKADEVGLLGRREAA
jgi:Rad52/22 family double-strand break repair protein